MARNVDGTENKRGKITKYVNLSVTIHGRTKNIKMLVTGLGKQKIILGFPWLNDENPDINWRSGEFKWRPRPFKVKKITGIWPLDMAKAKARQALTTIMEEKDKEERLNRTLNVRGHHSPPPITPASSDSPRYIPPHKRPNHRQLLETRP